MSPARRGSAEALSCRAVRPGGGELGDEERGDAGAAPVVDRFGQGPRALITASAPLAACSTAWRGDGELGGGADDSGDLVAVVQEPVDDEATGRGTRRSRPLARLHRRRAVCAMQAADRGFADVLAMTFPTAKALEARRAESYGAFLELIARAKDSGHLREELRPGGPRHPVHGQRRRHRRRRRGPRHLAPPRRPCAPRLRRPGAPIPALPEAPAPTALYRAMVRLSRNGPGTVQRGGVGSWYASAPRRTSAGKRRAGLSAVSGAGCPYGRDQC
ncbi:hypothetical protein QFZ22_001957 [Streptomyces canus]|uniref:Uncharacterized protein n=1 Tax=Streptomyces canus TaxID=58343 RepID=A0AAW8F793_9ACTN|nr:hypothetical protein [Streptomyces canus]